MQEELPAHDQTQRCRIRGTTPDQSFQIRLSDIEGCAEQLRETLSPSTAARYRKALLSLYDFLSADKRIYADTPSAWLESLKGQYSNFQVNLATSAYNAFLRYMGHEEHQLTRYIVRQEPSDKEISREEYLGLLAMAKRMHKPLAYAAMRTFACTGMQMSAFQALTVEEVRGGIITDGERTIRLPDSLREELLDYALHSGVRSGAIFIDKAGIPLKAEKIRMNIKAVSRAAGFADGVACARTLQKLYFAQRNELLSKEAERMMLAQADEEQAEHGWER